MAVLLSMARLSFQSTMPPFMWPYRFVPGLCSRNTCDFVTELENMAEVTATEFTT